MVIKLGLSIGEGRGRVRYASNINLKYVAYFQRQIWMCEMPTEAASSTRKDSTGTYYTFDGTNPPQEHNPTANRCAFYDVCNIPSLLSPRSKVIVNDTHMHFKSRTMYEGPEFEYYYVCRQQRDTRYLVTYQKKGETSLF